MKSLIKKIDDKVFKTITKAPIIVRFIFAYFLILGFPAICVAITDYNFLVGLFSTIVWGILFFYINYLYEKNDAADFYNG